MTSNIRAASLDCLSISSTNFDSQWMFWSINLCHVLHTLLQRWRLFKSNNWNIFWAKCCNPSVLSNSSIFSIFWTFLWLLYRLQMYTVNSTQQYFRILPNLSSGIIEKNPEKLDVVNIIKYPKLCRLCKCILKGLFTEYRITWLECYASLIFKTQIFHLEIKYS